MIVNMIIVIVIIIVMIIIDMIIVIIIIISISCVITICCILYVVSSLLIFRCNKYGIKSIACGLADLPTDKRGYVFVPLAKLW